MSTAATLINRALRLILVMPSGESPTAQETTDALTALNAMLESWNNDRLLAAYCMVDNSLTMVINTQTYTVGVSGNLNITRPIKFEDAYMTQSSVDSPVKLIDQDLWDVISFKTSTSSLVTKAFYNPTMTTSQGTLKVWPVPSAANVLHLITRISLADFAASTDTVTLPPGYERAITYNLAVEMAPEFNKPVPQIVMQTAIQSLAMIKRTNEPFIKAVSPVAEAMRKYRPNILNGP